MAAVILLLIGFKCLAIGLFVKKIFPSAISGGDAGPLLAEIAGVNLIYMGSVTLAGAVLVALLPAYSLIVMWGVFFGVIPLFGIRIIFGMKKYKAKNAGSD